MSITSALNNALTGLGAAGRAGAVVSSNVANAMTEGYARREINLSSQTLGGTGSGVKVDSVTRSVNLPVLQERRQADGEVANWSGRSEFLTRIEKVLGEPGNAGSLSDRVAQFGAALIAAASRPDSTPRLQVVLTAATDLADTVNAIGDAIQTGRREADHAIASQVDQLNGDLVRIDELNAEILAVRSLGRDANGLMDQRQSLIDRISTLVPVREVARPHDQISLYTTGGAILLEGNPAVVGFSPVGLITADMTLASNALGGLTVNGMAVATPPGGALGGGALEANFAIRDSLGTGLQADMDAFARDLIGRFSGTSVDPTLTGTDPGLFTDAGLAFDPLVETGLAGRLKINMAADPGQGGGLWRLRDGLGAASPGAVGNATLLAALADALSGATMALSGSFAGAAHTLSGLASDLLSRTTLDRQDADDRVAFGTGRQATLHDLQLEDGVDTDAEMQNLLLVEQAYSANARVIQTMDELIRQLIGL